MDRSGVAGGLALLVTFLWSTSWILIRWGLDDEALPPLTFAALRYGVAALILLVAIAGQAERRRAVRSLTRADLGLIVVLGIVLIALTQGAQFVAIDNQPAATTSMVLSATPLVVGLAASRSLGERPTRAQLSGATLVMLGALVYFAGNLGATAIGLVAATVGLGANAAGSLLGRRANRRQSTPAIVVTALSMASGALLLAFTGLALDGLPSVSGRAWLIIGWLAAVNTALAFTLWNVSLRHLSAIESAGINNTMLLQIALLAWWLLDEAPGWGGIAGIVLVSLGVLLTQARGSGPVAPRPTVAR